MNQCKRLKVLNLGTVPLSTEQLSDYAMELPQSSRDIFTIASGRMDIKAYVSMLVILAHKYGCNAVLLNTYPYSKNALIKTMRNYPSVVLVNSVSVNNIHNHWNIWE